MYQEDQPRITIFGSANVFYKAINSSPSLFSFTPLSESFSQFINFMSEEVSESNAGNAGLSSLCAGIIEFFMVNLN